MDIPFFEKLHSEGKLSGQSIQNIREHASLDLLSVHWELKILLYSGILLFTAGIGVVIYNNIDSIGHAVILFVIAAISIGCFYYCLKNKLPFSRRKVESPNSFFDYVLLTGCLTMLTLIGYLQFQYHVFGDQYGMATFIPMLLLFLTAYYFDHLGILAMAITNLAAWAGIAITPSKVLQDNNFDDSYLIYTGISLGILLLVISHITAVRKFKEHFSFTYMNFGMHLLFISVLSAMIHFEADLLWLIILCSITLWFYFKALQERSFYIMLFLSLYTYIGICYVVLKVIFNDSFGGMGPLYICCLYFILSGIAIIRFLLRMNKKIKSS